MKQGANPETSLKAKSRIAHQSPVEQKRFPPQFSIDRISGRNSGFLCSVLAVTHLEKHSHGIFFSCQEDPRELATSPFIIPSSLLYSRPRARENGSKIYCSPPSNALTAVIFFFKLRSSGGKHFSPKNEGDFLKAFSAYITKELSAGVISQPKNIA